MFTETKYKLQFQSATWSHIIINTKRQLNSLFIFFPIQQ